MARGRKEPPRKTEPLRLSESERADVVYVREAFGLKTNAAAIREAMKLMRSMIEVLKEGKQ